LFVLPTTTAICLAAHEPARTNESNATVKIRLGIATRLLIGDDEQQVTPVIDSLFAGTYAHPACGDRAVSIFAPLRLMMFLHGS
jgi:hypothetical protein